MGGLKSADAYEFEKTKGNTKCRLKKGEDENERKDAQMGPKGRAGRKADRNWRKCDEHNICYRSALISSLIIIDK